MNQFSPMVSMIHRREAPCPAFRRRLPLPPRPCRSTSVRIRMVCFRYYFQPSFTVFGVSACALCIDSQILLFSLSFMITDRQFYGDLSDSYGVSIPSSNSGSSVFTSQFFSNQHVLVTPSSIRAADRALLSHDVSGAWTLMRHYSMIHCTNMYLWADCLSRPFSFECVYVSLILSWNISAPTRSMPSGPRPFKNRMGSTSIASLASGYSVSGGQTRYDSENKFQPQLPVIDDSVVRQIKSPQRLTYSGVFIARNKSIFVTRLFEPYSFVTHASSDYEHSLYLRIQMNFTHVHNLCLKDKMPLANSCT
jgi:hypothetical protein